MDKLSMKTSLSYIQSLWDKPIANILIENMKLKKSNTKLLSKKGGKTTLLTWNNRVKNSNIVWVCLLKVLVNLSTMILKSTNRRY